MKILLTGSTGFIGCQVLKKLLENGHEVLTMGRKSAPNEAKHLVADIACWGSFEDRVRKFAPEVCIHAAWINTHDYSEIACRINLMAGMNFFNFCFGLDSVKQVIGLGSCLEYGDWRGSCEESRNPEANSFFTFCKGGLRSYGELHAKEKGKVFQWMRIFYAYGPGQRRSALIPSVIEALSQNLEPEIRNPEAFFDWIHVDDIASGIVRAAETPTSGTFNLGSGTPVLAKAACELLVNLWAGRPAELLPAERVDGFWSDNAKILEQLAWSPAVSLKQGLADLIATRKRG